MRGRGWTTADHSLTVGNHAKPVLLLLGLEWSNRHTRVRSHVPSTTEYEEH